MSHEVLREFRHGVGGPLRLHITVDQGLPGRLCGGGVHAEVHLRRGGEHAPPPRRRNAGSEQSSSGGGPSARVAGGLAVLFSCSSPPQGPWHQREWRAQRQRQRHAARSCLRVPGCVSSRVGVLGGSEGKKSDTHQIMQSMDCEGAKFKLCSPFSKLFRQLWPVLMPSEKKKETKTVSVHLPSEQCNFNNEGLQGRKTPAGWTESLSPDMRSTLTSATSCSN